MSVPANSTYVTVSYTFSLAAIGASTVNAPSLSLSQAAAPKIPVVSSISPMAGPPAGGTLVTITGLNLANATKVSFGSVAGVIKSDSATSITVKSPAGTGSVAVTVKTSIGTSAMVPEDQFTYSHIIQPCAGPITTDGEIVAGTYLVNCSIDVPAGITLAIDPGAILKFSSGDQVSVEGTLDAVGTLGNPITFTSINDNSVGGDTGSGSPATDDWEGITADGAGSIDIEHADIEYSAIAVSSYGSTSITIVNSTITASEIAVQLVTVSSVDIDGNTLAAPWGLRMINSPRRHQR